MIVAEASATGGAQPQPAANLGYAQSDIGRCPPVEPTEFGTFCEIVTTGSWEEFLKLGANTGWAARDLRLQAPLAGLGAE